MKPFLLLLLLAGIGRAAWLEWDRNPEFNVSGYRVYYGTNSRSYAIVYDAGDTNRVWLPRLRLQPAVIYFFAATAYGSDGLESAFSAEAGYVTPAPAPYVPVTNVVLRVPSGKYYVEGAQNLSAWTALGTVIGPTNVSCAATNPMGFFRWRPFFVAVKPSKAGKLTVPKSTIVKAVAKTPAVASATPSFPTFHKLVTPASALIISPPGTPPTAIPTP